MPAKRKILDHSNVGWKIIQDATDLFYHGMEAEAFLRFIASDYSDLMKWAKKYEPDAARRCK